MTCVKFGFQSLKVTTSSQQEVGLTQEKEILFNSTTPVWELFRYFLSFFEALQLQPWCELESTLQHSSLPCKPKILPLVADCSPHSPPSLPAHYGDWGIL
eukprot:2805266-Amphidinium_carterae.1